MKVAVIGSGVSGLYAAFQLSSRHDVVLFESEARLGGHAHTVEVAGDRACQPVDTGFIVFNTRTYPLFVQWLTRLGITPQPAEMSFSVRSERRAFEYGSASLDALFAQRRHLLSPRFHRMWRDVLRFYRSSRELLAPGSEVRLEEYLRANGYSEAFIADHLLPLVGAVWSSNRQGVRDFPARLLVRFFDHHGFLQRQPGLQWLTIPGGSREYVRAVAAGCRAEVRLASPVDRIARADGRVMVTVRGHAPEAFDHAIVAAHADEALALIEQPTPAEREVLGAFQFLRNDVALHTDEQLMPTLRRTWSSWNYHLDEGAASGACVTYWMNQLQTIPGRTQYFVTLNRTAAIRPDRILRRFTYAHPFFTPAVTSAQVRHDDLIDHQSVSYCGAYWRNGFHEDGVASAHRVCEQLGALR